MVVGTVGVEDFDSDFFMSGVIFCVSSWALVIPLAFACRCPERSAWPPTGSRYTLASTMRIMLCGRFARAMLAAAMLEREEITITTVKGH
jgi:hypothetical protein